MSPNESYYQNPLFSTRMKLNKMGYSHEEISSIEQMINPTDKMVKAEDDCDTENDSHTTNWTGGRQKLNNTGSTSASTNSSGNIGSAHTTSNSIHATSSFGVGVNKSKIRYVIVKNNGATLELREQSRITPEEMIGLSKFLGLIPSYLTMVLSDLAAVYNLNITWSEIIKNLSIEKHFVDGLPVHAYNSDAEVLDIFLYDSP